MAKSRLIEIEGLKMDQDIKQVIIIRKDLNMRKGKMIAMGAHASLAVFLNHGGINPYTGEFHSKPFSPQAAQWMNDGFKKVVVYVNSELELIDIHQKAKDAGILTTLITDNGKTEFHGVLTKTAVAVGPDYLSVIDPITGHLPLL